MSKIGDIGLGLILAKINFNVGIKQVASGHGFKITRHITFSAHTPQQWIAMWTWAEENDLPGLAYSNWVDKRRIGKIRDIQFWLDALEPYTDLLKHKGNYERMAWVIENPVPRAHESYDTFLKWAAEWDSKNAEFGLN
tara:strand:+ start:9508 stop:9921 length:414 start_codon:yes stop_codon:yes gene_type:complete